MSELQVLCAQLGPIATNTYILVDEDTKDAMIIDPAGNADLLIQYLEDNELTLDGVMLTHGHHDHIGGLAGLREKYELHHRARLAIKPGITGLWQVSGRSNITDFEEVVELDKKYIREWSMGLDFRILLQTIKVVLGKDGSM